MASYFIGVISKNAFFRKYLYKKAYLSKRLSQKMPVLENAYVRKWLFYITLQQWIHFMASYFIGVISKNAYFRKNRNKVFESIHISENAYLRKCLSQKTAGINIFHNQLIYRSQLKKMPVLENTCIKKLIWVKTFLRKNLS